MRVEAWYGSFTRKTCDTRRKPTADQAIWLTEATTKSDARTTRRSFRGLRTHRRQTHPTELDPSQTEKEAYADGRHTPKLRHVSILARPG